jgi:hypothetical protein
MRRVVLGALALLHGWWGAWAYLWPGDFYRDFPGFGHRWTAAYTPYNEHLVSDLGATFLTLAVLLALAAYRDDTKVTRVVLAGVIVFSALHLAFHARSHGLMHGFDLAASLATLALGVVVPAALLVSEFLRADTPRRRG